MYSLLSGLFFWMFWDYIYVVSLLVQSFILLDYILLCKFKTISLPIFAFDGHY